MKLDATDAVPEVHQRSTGIAAHNSVHTLVVCDPCMTGALANWFPPALGWVVALGAIRGIPRNRHVIRTNIQEILNIASNLQMERLHTFDCFPHPCRIPHLER